MIRLSRTIRFNAGRSLWRPEWSDEKNRAVYGDEGPHGYGHNYELEVEVEGHADPETGMVVNLTAIDRILREEVDAPLDHRNLNELPPFDEELNPSAENLARFILEYLNGRVGDDRVQVYKVRCFETPTSVATYQI